MGTIRKITLFSFLLAAVAGTLGKIMPKRKFMGFVVKKGLWGVSKHKLKKLFKTTVHNLYKAKRHSTKGWKKAFHISRMLART